jgi:hypothetical protein
VPWTPQSEAVPKSVSTLLVRLDEPAGPSLPLTASNALKRALTRTAVGLVDDDVEGDQLELTRFGPTCRLFLDTLPTRGGGEKPYVPTRLPPLMGNIGSHLDLTSGWREHQPRTNHSLTRTPFQRATPDRSGAQTLCWVARLRWRIACDVSAQRRCVLKGEGSAIDGRSKSSSGCPTNQELDGCSKSRLPMVSPLPSVISSEVRLSNC